MWPGAPAAYAIARPSGEIAGSSSRPASLVTRINLPTVSVFGASLAPCTA